jgi:NAD(P)-dependent dehydrogenase (short-subunit alcohol dehydrogenase family)
MTLTGTAAVVTGSSTGIGLACARALLAAGAEGLLVNGRDPGRAEEARAGLQRVFPNARLAVAAGDMGHAEDAVRVMATAHEAFGRIDVLVNSTGGTDVPRLLHDTPLQDLAGILDRCLLPQLTSCRAALPYMRAARRGCVVNIASDAAKLPTPGETVIGAAMAGIVMFTRALAIEGRRDGIRANVVTPSLTSGTRHFEAVMSDPFAGRVFAKAAKLAALGVVDKDELAQLVVFLATPAAAKITGQAISMNGGISAL